MRAPIAYLFSLMLLFPLTLPAQSTLENDLHEALNYLNAIRANPGVYSQEIGINLKDIAPQPGLHWNDTLAKVAQQKAQDMAKRNYFAHTDPDGNGINILIHKAGYTLPADWIKPRNSNSFESIAAGSENPQLGIIQLINDGNVQKHSKAGHRLHLLGMNDWWAGCSEIGIGWATTSRNKYPSYMCVIIAKRGW